MVIERHRLGLESREEVASQIPQGLEGRHRQQQPMTIVGKGPGDDQQAICQHRRSEIACASQIADTRHQRAHAVVRQVAALLTRQQNGVNHNESGHDGLQHQDRGCEQGQADAGNQRRPIGLHPAEQPNEHVDVQCLVRELGVKSRIVTTRRGRRYRARGGVLDAAHGRHRAASSLSSRSRSSAALRATACSWLLCTASRLA